MVHILDQLLTFPEDYYLSPHPLAILYSDSDLLVKLKGKYKNCSQPGGSGTRL